MTKKKMITVYAEILQETEKAILVSCDEDADGEWLPKSQIKYDGERGDTGVKIEIPELLAEEKGFFDGMGRAEVEAAPVPEQQETVIIPITSLEPDEKNPEKTEIRWGMQVGSTFTDFCVIVPTDHILSVTEETEGILPKIEMLRANAEQYGLIQPMEYNAPEDPAGKRAFGDNVKWIKKEAIDIRQPLSEAERARYAEEMAALDKEIEELEYKRAAVSSSLKKQIDAKEQERRKMSAHINDGELRTFSCDCLKDYNTEEMVWMEAYPPYNEVKRRKMTLEEMQPSLLEYEEKIAVSTASDGEVEPFCDSCIHDSNPNAEDDPCHDEQDAEVAQ